MPRPRFLRLRERKGGRRARRILLPALIVFVLLLLGACGGNDEPLNTPQTSDTSAVAPKPASAAEATDQAMDNAQSGAPSSRDGRMPDKGITLKASVADNVDEACVGAKEITVEPDALLFFCVQVANQGRIPLADVEILSQDRHLDLGTFIIADGDSTRIDPDGLLIATLVEPVVDGRLAGQIARDGLEVLLEASAIPVNADGVEMEELFANSRILVQVQEDDSPTGFRTAMGAGVDTLLSYANRFPLVLGFTVLLLPVLGLVVAMVCWVYGRRKAGRAPT